MAIWLYNPNKFFARVVEVEANLVCGRTNRLSTRVLELLDEVFVWVLSHAAALIRVKVDVIHVKGSRNEGLRVSVGNLLVCAITSSKLGYSPEALINCAEVKVNLYLVVLKSTEWECETWVAAEP